MSEPRRGDDAEVDDAASADRRWLRPAVWLLTIFIVVVLLALPILRAISVDRGQDTASAQRDARAFVATQFASAVLERRSTRLAAVWARDDLRAAVDRAVGEVQLRDSQELIDATAATYRVNCPGGEALGAGNECYRAELTQPDGTPVAQLSFTVSIVDGRALVVALEPGTNVASPTP